MGPLCLWQCLECMVTIWHNLTFLTCTGSYYLRLLGLSRNLAIQSNSITNRSEAISTFDYLQFELNFFWGFFLFLKNHIPGCMAFIFKLFIVIIDQFKGVILTGHEKYNCRFKLLEPKIGILGLWKANWGKLEKYKIFTFAQKLREIWLAVGDE